MPSFRRYVRARSLSHERKTASIARRSWAHGSDGTSGTPTIERKLASNRSRQARAKASSPVTRARPAVVASFETEVEDRVHHPGHRHGRAGAHADEERIGRVAEPPSERGLDAAHPLAQLVVEAGRPAVGEEAPAGLGRDDEARRHGQAEVAGHHAEVRGLAAEEGSGVRLGESEGLVERVGGGHGGWVSGPASAVVVVSAASASRSARQTRSGVSGRSRMTTPVASRTAAATAGATFSSAPSLMPFEPYGPGPVLVLDDGALHRQWQVHARRDLVVDRTEVPDATLVVEQDLLHQRVAEGHDRGALVLAADLARDGAPCRRRTRSRGGSPRHRRSLGRPRPRPRCS